MGQAHRGTTLRSRDRLWSGTRTTILDGPLDLPPVDDLRRAAALLARDFAAARLGQTLDLQAERWRRPRSDPAAVAARAVVVHDGPGPELVGATAFARALESHRSDDVPVRWVVAGRYLALLICHEVGDGALMLGLQAALLETAGTGQVPAWTQAPSLRAPLLRAMLHHYGRDPRRVLATLASSRRGAGGAQDSLHPSGPTTPLLRSPAGVHAVVPADAAQAMTAWRKALGGRVSPLAVHAALVQAALRAVDLPPRGAPFLLVDARRYLPQGATVHGNFVAGLRLPVTATAGATAGGAWEPKALTAALDDGVAGARPLSAMAVGVLRQLRARARGVPAGPDFGGVGADPRPVVAVTSMRSPFVEELPWSQRPAASIATSFSTAAPAEGVTASVTESRGHVHLSLSFHDTVYDTAVMSEALRLAAADPVRLLAGPRAVGSRA